MMSKGKIKRKVDDRGFGFISPSEGGKDIFFHISGLHKTLVWEDVREGDKVEFDTEMTDKGLRAIKVQKVN